MPPFLRSAHLNKVPAQVDENRNLLDEFAALDTTRQSEAADHLAVLWHCFVEEFRSPSEFQQEPRSKQDGYIAKFERVAARSARVKHTEKGHLHYSVALMLHFLFIARDGAHQQSALDLSGRVANLINGARDRQLATRRSQLVNALSTSLLDSSEQASTEVIVERSANFHLAPETGGPSVGVSDDVSRPPRRRAIYERDGERWVKRSRITPVRRAG
jgi:hypothetical protein